MGEKSQRINGMTFQSEAEAKEWIAQNIPFAERSSQSVSNVRSKKLINGKWGIFQCDNDLDGLEFQQADQSGRTNRASIDLTPQNEEERAEFENFIGFLKPRVDNALSGNFSKRTVDEIFNDVNKEMEELK